MTDRMEPAAHYLDNAATTKVCPEAAQAALDAMTSCWGNPSSTHAAGRAAKHLLDDCRRAVADALGASPEEVVFTSCGTESDNWALIRGAAAGRRIGRHVISSLVEHDAVRRSLDALEREGYEITRLRPDATGAIPVSAVAEALRPDTCLVTLMLVNNETGAVTDVRAVADALRAAGSRALLHTDAVQGFRKVPFRAKTLGADLISVSGHKIHAVKGVGALYVRKGVRIEPFLVGGEQESGRRAGTEAVPQIAAFAAACRLDPQIDRMAAMKAALCAKLTAAVPELTYLDTAAPHILNVSMPGWRSEVLMSFLETRGVYVSKSSACKQGKRSHVLEAIGLPPAVIDGALRIGLSRYTTEEDLDALTQGLADARALAHR